MDDIDQLLEEILVDAYGEDEQLGAFEVAFEESAGIPFTARIVGAAVEVVKVEYDGDGRRGLTAICRRDDETRRVSLADLTPGPVTLDTSRLLDAYRRWSGLPALNPTSPARLHPRSPGSTGRPPAVSCPSPSPSPSSPKANGIRRTSNGGKTTPISTLGPSRSSPPGRGPRSRWNR